MDTKLTFTGSLSPRYHQLILIHTYTHIYTTYIYIVYIYSIYTHRYIYSYIYIHTQVHAYFIVM